jgi:hypothetical protein
LATAFIAISLLLSITTTTPSLPSLPLHHHHHPTSVSLLCVACQSHSSLLLRTPPRCRFRFRYRFRCRALFWCIGTCLWCVCCWIVSESYCRLCWGTSSYYTATKPHSNITTNTLIAILHLLVPSAAGSLVLTRGLVVQQTHRWY